MNNTIKNIAHILCAGGIVGFFTFTSMVSMVHAETVIIEGFLQSDTVWSKANSPYLLDDTVTVPSDKTLTIEPGVEIRTKPNSENWPYIYVAGKLVAKGSPDNPIKIGDIWGITVDHGSANISNTVINMHDSLMFIGAEGRIATSTISNFVDGVYSNGISINSSLVTIHGSRIDGNKNGIVVEQSGDIFQVRNNRSSPTGNFGGLRNFLEDLVLIKSAQAQAQVTNPSVVTITGSSLSNNIQTAIRNNDSIEVHAKNDWWGSAEGPQLILGNTSAGMVPNGLKGPVAYDPWLDRDPLDVPDIQVPSCCSSILFLPGLEASRLYRSEPALLGLGTSTNKLWEPNRNDDVRKLFLNSNGSSIDPAIYVGGPIGKALGFVEVYDSFMIFLDELSEKGTIAEWKSFGYDWRMPITEVVAGRTQRATTTDSLIETVESLASRSKTGKITLIAHSNGGLVAKYLVKTLTDLGKENIIDSVISVAVPYLGTPQAILSLLHGDGQSLAGGMILRKSVAKELGTNMASSYPLLPSVEYFAKAFGPTIAYASATTAPITSPIISAEAQNSFIGARTNQALLTAGEILHGILDPFTWPTTIARWAIVGWGNKTAKGIVYSGKNNSIYSATTTSMGDGTVVAPSAAYNAGTTTAIDLVSVSDLAGRDFNHANILGASATKASIEELITIDNHNKNAKLIEENLVKIPGVTIGEPDYSKEATFLVVSTHSPVELHLYDKQGNHTGIISKPVEADEEIEEGLYTFFEEKIPGSSFEFYGDEEDPDTYISVPDSRGQTYSVAIQGIGIGEFTYKVERIRGEEVLDSVTYASLPVTPLMTASSTVSTQTNDATVQIKLASSTPVLKVDIDGNGSVDISAKPNAVSDPLIFLESLKKMVMQLSGTNSRSKNIIKRIDRLEELVKKGKYKKLYDNSEKLKEKITHKKSKVLSESEKNQIMKMIEVFIAQFE